jgi:hypothetical protein
MLVKSAQETACEDVSSKALSRGERHAVHTTPAHKASPSFRGSPLPVRIKEKTSGQKEAASGQKTEHGAAAHRRGEMDVYRKRHGEVRRERSHGHSTNDTGQTGRTDGVVHGQRSHGHATVCDTVTGRTGASYETDGLVHGEKSHSHGGSNDELRVSEHAFTGHVSSESATLIEVKVESSSSTEPAHVRPKEEGRKSVSFSTPAVEETLAKKVAANHTKHRVVSESESELPGLGKKSPANVKQRESESDLSRTLKHVKGSAQHVTLRDVARDSAVGDDKHGSDVWHVACESMCMRVCTYMCMHVCTYVYACMHVYVYACFVSVCLYVRVSLCVCMYVYAYIYTCMGTYICILCIYLCVFIYMYTYIHTFACIVTHFCRHKFGLRALDIACDRVWIYVYMYVGI